MEQLYLLRAFVAAAQHRSFSKAADALGVTTGSVSKAIAKLEASVQTRLLHRTTRSVTLTEEAQSYYLSCRRLLEELDEAHRRIMREREVDAGRLRLVVHPVLAGDTFCRFLSRYRTLAPHVNLSVSIQESATSLYDGRVDIAILPPTGVEQSAAIRRSLLKTARVLTAAPRYLAGQGTPKQAGDLSTHFLLLPPHPARHEPGTVTLIANGETLRIVPASSMDGNDALLRSFALAGSGIAALPAAMIRDDLAAGNLVPVLPECGIAGGDVELCLFYAHRELLPTRFRTFVDFCVAFFREHDQATWRRASASPAEARADHAHAQQRVAA